MSILSLTLFMNLEILANYFFSYHGLTLYTVLQSVKSGQLFPPQIKQTLNLAAIQLLRGME